MMMLLMFLDVGMTSRKHLWCLRRCVADAAATGWGGCGGGTDSSSSEKTYFGPAFRGDVGDDEWGIFHVVGDDEWGIAGMLLGCL